MHNFIHNEFLALSFFVSDLMLSPSSIFLFLEKIALFLALASSEVSYILTLLDLLPLLLPPFLASFIARRSWSASNNLDPACSFES